MGRKNSTCDARGEKTMTENVVFSIYEKVRLTTAPGHRDSYRMGTRINIKA